MSIGNLSIILLLGILNLILALFQLSTGKRWIKIPMKFHRRSGILLVISALIHGVLAILSDLL